MQIMAYFRPQKCGLPLQRCYIVFLLFYNYDNDFNLLKSTRSSPKKVFNTGESAQQISEQATPVVAGNPQFKQGHRVWNSALQ